MADKKEKNSIKLPKAWKSIKNRNDMAQARGNFEALGGLIAGVIVAIIIAFILLGGISQKGLINFCFDWSHNVMNKVSGWIEGGGVEVTDDGIYLNPGAVTNGGGSASQNQNDSQNKNQTEEQNNPQNEEQNENSNAE